jgi:hypothetical protein
MDVAGYAKNNIYICFVLICGELFGGIRVNRSLVLCDCNWKTVNGVEYTTNTTHWKVCELENTTVPVTCGSIHYDPEMSTVVSEVHVVNI